jgi:hypothetical protein
MNKLENDFFVVVLFDCSIICFVFDLFICHLKHSNLKEKKIKI